MKMFWPGKRGTLDYQKLLDAQVAEHDQMVKENRVMGSKNRLSMSVKSGLDQWIIAYTPPPKTVIEFPAMLAIVVALELAFGGWLLYLLLGAYRSI